jgi:hypothetical protein
LAEPQFSIGQINAFVAALYTGRLRSAHSVQHRANSANGSAGRTTKLFANAGPVTPTSTALGQPDIAAINLIAAL